MERERDYQYGETRKGDQPRGLKYVRLSGGYQSAEFRCQGSSAEPQEAKPSKSQDYAAKIQRRLNKHRIDCIRNYVSKNYPESSDSQASQSINVELAQDLMAILNRCVTLFIRAWNLPILRPVIESSSQ